MKLKFTFLAMLACVLLISACTKESLPTNPPAATYPIEGIWLGTYSVNSIPSQGQLFYSFAIYPDGKIVTRSKGADGVEAYSSGTWKLSADNIFTATITAFTSSAKPGVVQSITATYSNTGVITNGVWTDTVNPYGSLLSGKFSTMQRIN